MYFRKHIVFTLSYLPYLYLVLSTFSNDVRLS